MYSAYVFSIRKIAGYIEKGFISKHELNEEIKSNAFFRKDEEQDWEKLWWWEKLDDKLFVELRDKVWRQLSKGEINSIYVVLHIASIFINLIDQNLINKNKKYVLTKSKQIIKRLYQESKSNINQDLVHGYIDSHSFGKEYQSKETTEFLELKEFLNKQMTDYQFKISRDYMKNLFEDLKEESVNILYSKLDEVLPNHHGTYERTAIFKYVDGRKLGRRIKAFNSKVIYDFKYFVHRRYYPEEIYTNGTLEKYHFDDLDCLIALKDELQKKPEGSRTY